MKKILINIPDELLQLIEDYRFNNRLNTRTEAILSLIKKGLEAKGEEK